MKLNDINWGADSAENDPHLLEYFQYSAAFTRLSQKQKQLVVGRKGSGKSALRQKLTEHFSSQDETFVIAISPTFNVIRSILNDRALVENFGDEVFFQHTWLRQILLDCLVAVGHKAKGSYATDSMAFARKVADELNRTSKDLLENISDVLTKVRAKVGNLGEFGIQLEKELRNIADVDALEHHLTEISKKGAKFVVIFDDLDQGWDNSKLSNDLILGLLRAAMILNGKIENLFPMIFLREDVYTLLMPLTQHADKYRNIEPIKWGIEELMNLLADRINFNRKQFGLGPEDQPFHSVFPVSVGTTHTDNWLFERTLARPRELLQLARIYTESLSGEEPSDSALKQAEVGYSSWKLSDLCSEYSNQYPGLSELFACWKSLFRRRSYHLRRSDLEEVIMSLMVNAPVNQLWFNDIVASTDINKLISILFEIGVLGDYISGGAGGGAKAFYSYMGPHQPRFEEVQIHPCFRRALETVERIRS